MKFRLFIGLLAISTLAFSEETKLAESNNLKTGAIRFCVSEIKSIGSPRCNPSTNTVLQSKVLVLGAKCDDRLKARSIRTVRWTEDLGQACSPKSSSQQFPVNLSLYKKGATLGSFCVCGYNERQYCDSDGGSYFVSDCIDDEGIACGTHSEHMPDVSCN